MLLWQPQKGKKQGVRWYDFGGSKKQAEAMGLDPGLDLIDVAYRSHCISWNLCRNRSSQAAVPAGSLQRRPTAYLAVLLASEIAE